MKVSLNEYFTAVVGYKLSGAMLPYGKIPTKSDIQVGITRLVSDFSFWFVPVDEDSSGKLKWTTVPAGKKGLARGRYENLFELSNTALALAEENSPKELARAATAILLEKDKTSHEFAELEEIDLESVAMDRVMRKDAADHLVFLASLYTSALRGVAPLAFNPKSRWHFDDLQRLFDAEVRAVDADEGVDPYEVDHATEAGNVESYDDWDIMKREHNQIVQAQLVEFDKIEPIGRAYRSWYQLMPLIADEVKAKIAEERESAMDFGKKNAAAFPVTGRDA
jgi:hypothetical protein